MDWLWWLAPPCVRKTVIVNLKADDTALRGVLWRTAGPWLVLRQASALKPHGEPIAIDGEAVVHRADVLFMQVLP